MGRNGEDQEGGIVHTRIRQDPPGSNPVWVSCSCGADWSHDKNATQEQMDSVFESHKAYFNRPKVMTL